MRLIDADAFREQLNSAYEYTELGEVIEMLDNAPTVEITEEQAIDKLHETGWLPMHDKEMTERPQGERTERALTIIDRLRTDEHINNKECGTLRRAILLPERRQGKWVDTGDMQEYWAEEYQCSICGAKDHWHNYCPNCGADMRGGKEE